MWRTRVGYTGGSTKDPTYRTIGDHTEAIEVAYDPAVISYAALLDVFYEGHRPTSAPWSRQYRSAVWTSDPQEIAAAQARRRKEEAWRGARIYTDIEPLGRFYVAEDYHQKYRLQGEPLLMAEFSKMYPDGRSFVYSTAAMRANAFLDGEGGPRALEELRLLGLSAEAEERLRERVQ